MLPKTSHVTIQVYNILGQEVLTLIDEKKDAGHYLIIWNGRDENDRGLASGVYFCLMKAQDFVQSKKMMILK